MIERIISIIRNFNKREKILAILGVVIVLYIFSSSAYEKIQTKIASQNARLKKAQDELLALPYQLERYLLLKKRKENIETVYKEIEFADGFLTHIEELIREKAGVESSTDYKINALPETEFGGDYIREPYRIEVFVTSLENLSAFLKSLVAEENPLVMTKLNIKKAPNKTKLIVQIDVSNFRKI